MNFRICKLHIIKDITFEIIFHIIYIYIYTHTHFIFEINIKI